MCPHTWPIKPSLNMTSWYICVKSEEGPFKFDQPNNNRESDHSFTTSFWYSTLFDRNCYGHFSVGHPVLLRSPFDVHESSPEYTYT